VCGEDVVTVVGVQRADEKIRIVPPFLHAVAEQRLDLVARKDVRARFVERIHIDDEWELLHERAVATLDLASFVVHCRSRGRRVHAALHETEIGRKGVTALTPKGDSTVIVAP
jgi:hypothetical protein